MSNLNKLLNNYCVVQLLKNHCTFGTKDEIIFSNFEELLFFIDEIRADEREGCAKVCDDLAANDKLSNYYAVAAKAIRERVIDASRVGEVGVWGEK